MKKITVIYVASNLCHTISFHGKTRNEAAVLASNWVSRNPGVNVIKVK